MRLIDADAITEKMVNFAKEKLEKNGEWDGRLDLIEIGYVIGEMPTLTLHWEVVQADDEGQAHD